MRFLLGLILLVALIIGAGIWATRGAPVDMARFDGIAGDAANGEVVFYAGGCASCHAAPDSDDKTALAGGYRIQSDFGTFVSPNISMSSEHGLGDWTLDEFATAMLEGVAPDGSHYYPAFPYTTYTRMEPQDVADLWAFLQTLPAVEVASADHELPVPLPLRPVTGIWKALFMGDGWRLKDPQTDEIARGRYLVEALGHCGECHTPRNLAGALSQSDWLSGAPNPSGRGTIPGIDPTHLEWSAEDIAYYLETGFTPDFDSAGGTMADVVLNTGRLSPEDRLAIASYLKALPN